MDSREAAIIELDSLPPRPVPDPTVHADVSTMEPEMYLAAQNGDVQYLKSRTPRISLASFLTPQNNTLLHLAIIFTQLEFAAEVLTYDKLLLFRPNSKGDTPLHIAARSGNLPIVKLLISYYRDATRPYVDLESGRMWAPIPEWRAANCDGNTALHEALIFNHPRVAHLLLKEDPGLADCDNNLMESPLYLAANLGFDCVAERIMCIEQEEEHTISLNGPNGRTPLHGVASFWARVNDIIYVHNSLNIYTLSGIPLKRKEACAPRRVIATLLCEKMESTAICQRDDFGRTALHYAASTGAIDVTFELLKTNHELAYIRDKDGFTPLLIAIASRYQYIINMILRFCPDCAEIRDFNGQNALHLIMRDNLSPQLKTMRNPVLKELLNERDNYGNTPLHLAVKTSFLSGIRRLLPKKGINLRAQNNEGHTALDLVEKWDSIVMKNSFKMKLIRQGADRAGKQIGLTSFRKFEPPVGEIKQLANTLLIVSTLLMTISFTAAFTLPGGYSQNPPDDGLAVFGKKAAFKVFLFFDTVAFISSVASAYFLTWGLVGVIGFNYLRVATSHAMWWLTVALFATMVAFSTGLYVVTGNKCKWLAILILILSSGIPLWLLLGGQCVLFMAPFQRDEDKSAD